MAIRPYHYFFLGTEWPVSAPLFPWNLHETPTSGQQALRDRHANLLVRSSTPSHESSISAQNNVPHVSSALEIGESIFFIFLRSKDDRKRGRGEKKKKSCERTRASGRKRRGIEVIIIHCWSIKIDQFLYRGEHNRLRNKRPILKNDIFYDRTPLFD